MKSVAITTALIAMLLNISLAWEYNFTDWDNKLFQDLMADYNPLTMPQTGTTPSRPTVQIQLEIYGVREVDLMGSTVAFKAAFRQWWNDSRLMWDPADYGNITYFFLPSDPDSEYRSWISDMSIRQDAGTFQLLSDMKYTQVRVTYTGVCYYSLFGDIKVIAGFDLQSYPYDKQVVDMTFGSWLYTDDRLHVELYNPAFLVQAPQNWQIDSIEWEFTDHNVTLIQSNAASGFYLRYNYQVTMQRIGGTILIAIVIPGALITFLGLLYILLPKGDGARTDYLATILLTEIMFLVMITSLVPLSKFVPGIGYLFLAYVILLTVVMLGVLIMEKIQQALIEDVEDAQKELKEQKKDLERKGHLKKLIKQSQQQQKQQEMEDGPFSRLSKRQDRYKQGVDFEEVALQEKDEKDLSGDPDLDKLNQEEIAIYEEIRALSKKIKAYDQKLAKGHKNIFKIDISLFSVGIAAFILISAVIMSQFQTE